MSYPKSTKHLQLQTLFYLQLVAPGDRHVVTMNQVERSKHDRQIRPGKQSTSPEASLYTLPIYIGSKLSIAQTHGDDHF